MNPEQVRRFCPAGHIYQLKPTFEPCCSQALADPYIARPNPQRRRCQWEKWERKKAEQANRWPRIRAFIRLRDQGRCRYCGNPGFEVDHVVPTSKRGDAEEFDNLVWSCGPCNRLKGSERGFTMKNNVLRWHGKIVSAQQGIFGTELMKEISDQRLERQVRQGLVGMVSFKTGGAL